MNSVTFDNIMKAMDAVDSLRHRESIVDTEVSTEERDRLLIAKLRDAYAAQGTVVSDDVLKKSVASLNEKRFVHEPMKAGWRRVLATLYVRRNKYGKRTLLAFILAAAMIAGPTIYLKRQEAGRIEREAAAVKAFDVLIAKTLPEELKRSTAGALRAAEDAGLSSQRSAEINRRNADGRAALEARSAERANAEIAKIDGIRKEMEVALVSRRLNADADKLIADARDAAKSEGARKALGAVAIELQQAAASGSEKSFESAKDKLSALVAEIKLPLTIKIVDRPSVKSGVWRMKNGDSTTKQYYLVVEAAKVDGTVTTRQVRNSETDKVQDVSIWGVRVPESVYNTVAMEKRTTGFISERAVGAKKSGSVEIDWTIPTTGAAITSW
jgi:hypothetical protein